MFANLYCHPLQEERARRLAEGLNVNVVVDSDCPRDAMYFGRLGDTRLIPVPEAH